MATFLRPVLERAGYHVTASLKPGETAAVVLAMEDDPIPDHAAGPLVRLSRMRGEAGASSIYRYDRAGLLGALAAHRTDARACTESGSAAGREREGQDVEISGVRDTI